MFSILRICLPNWLNSRRMTSTFLSQCLLGGKQMWIVLVETDLLLFTFAGVTVVSVKASSQYWNFSYRSNQLRHQKFHIEISEKGERLTDFLVFSYRKVISESTSIEGIEILNWANSAKWKVSWLSYVKKWAFYSWLRSAEDEFRIIYSYKTPLISKQSWDKYTMKNWDFYSQKGTQF